MSIQTCTHICEYTHIYVEELIYIHKKYIVLMTEVPSFQL